MAEGRPEGLRLRKPSSTMKVNPGKDEATTITSTKTLEQELEETGSVTLCPDVDDMALEDSLGESEEAEEVKEDDDDQDEAQPGCSGLDDIDFEILTCQVPGLVHAKVRNNPLRNLICRKCNTLVL